MTDTDGWTMETLQQYLETKISENQRISDDRWTQQKEAFDRDRESIDKRFDQANRYKETYSQRLSELNNEAPKRIEVDTRINAIQEKLDERLNSLQEKLSLVERRQNSTDWPLYASFAGIIAVMIGALWTLIGQQIQVTTQPIVVAMEQVRVSNENRDRTIADLRNDFNHLTQNISEATANRNKDTSLLMQNNEASKVDRNQLNERVRQIEGQVASSLQADANSKTDRIQLNDRITKLEDTTSAGTADRKANEASLKANLVEIETQFCGSDTVRNLMHANDLRVMFVLWKKAGLGEYPISNAYYPQVCNRNINPK